MYRILIVEDNAGIAAAMKKHIEAWGLEAMCVEDFQNVLTAFSEYGPHLVLLDISLPFFNGYHWCSEIRRVSKVPIVFISSASENMNIVMAMNMGGDDFIAKPFDLTVFMAKIQAILRRTYDFSGQVSVLEHRGALLNTADATLTYRGGAHRPDEERLPHPTGADGAQGPGGQPRKADGTAVGDRQLCG